MRLNQFIVGGRQLVDGLEGTAVVTHVSLLIALDSRAAYPKRLSLLDLVDGAGLLTSKRKCQTGAQLAQDSDGVLSAWYKCHGINDPVWLCV